MEPTSNNTTNKPEEDFFDTPYQSATTQNAKLVGISKSEYCKYYADKSLKKDILWVGIFCYILAVLNLVVALSGGISTILDALILLGLGLGIHLKKSLICSIILSVYGTISVILSIIFLHRLTGWLIPVLGICGIIYTSTLHKEYKEKVS